MRGRDAVDYQKQFLLVLKSIAAEITSLKSQNNPSEGLRTVAKKLKELSEAL